MKSTGVLVVAVFLAGLMACTTPPTHGTYGDTRVLTAEEIAVKECYPLITELTPYKPAGVPSAEYVLSYAKKYGPFPRQSSKEESMTGGRVRYSKVPVNGVTFGEYILDPYVLMSQGQFVEYVKRHAAEYHAEKVQYARSAGEVTYAMTATVVRAKSRFVSQYRNPTGFQDDFFVQIVRDGKPCGVWEAVPKE